jgi:hypothetical protein
VDTSRRKAPENVAGGVTVRVPIAVPPLHALYSSVAGEESTKDGADSPVEEEVLATANAHSYQMGVLPTPRVPQDALETMEVEESEMLAAAAEHTLGEGKPQEDIGYDEEYIGEEPSAVPHHSHHQAAYFSNHKNSAQEIDEEQDMKLPASPSPTDSAAERSPRKQRARHHVAGGQVPVHVPSTRVPAGAMKSGGFPIISSASNSSFTSEAKYAEAKGTYQDPYHSVSGSIGKNNGFFFSSFFCCR